MRRPVGTCESSIKEPLTKGSNEKCCNNNCKFVGNSSESVILGEKTFKKDVGIQASVSDKNMVKHCDASD